jgi:glutamyl-tRNA reductase
VGPTIQEFRESLEAIRREEVEKHIHRFRAEDRELLELVTKRILNKILHHPTTTLKQGVQNGSGGAEGLIRSSILRELFGLSDNGKEKHEE